MQKSPKLIVAGAVGLAVVGFALSSFANPIYLKLGIVPPMGDFDSCQLSEMRGQDGTMGSVVMTYCARLHHRSTVLYTKPKPSDWQYETKGIDRATLRILEVGDHVYTKAIVRVAGADCDDVSKGTVEWSDPIAVRLSSSQEGTFDLLFLSAPCANLVSVEGYPR